MSVCWFLISVSLGMNSMSLSYSPFTESRETKLPKAPNYAVTSAWTTLRHKWLCPRRRRAYILPGVKQTTECHFATRMFTSQRSLGSRRSLCFYSTNRAQYRLQTIDNGRFLLTNCTQERLGKFVQTTREISGSCLWRSHMHNIILYESALESILRVRWIKTQGASRTETSPSANF